MFDVSSVLLYCHIPPNDVHKLSISASLQKFLCTLPLPFPLPYPAPQFHLSFSTPHLQSTKGLCTGQPAIQWSGLIAVPLLVTQLVIYACMHASILYYHRTRLPRFWCQFLRTMDAYVCSHHCRLNTLHMYFLFSFAWHPFLRRCSKFWQRTWGRTWRGMERWIKEKVWRGDVRNSLPTRSLFCQRVRGWGRCYRYF